MKADGSPDYAGGFLETIVGVGWASGWIGIEFAQNINGSISSTFQVDFPDSAGGTPGLIPFNGVQPGFGPSGAASYVKSPLGGPYQASWLAGVLTTNAGQSFTGFATYDPTPFNTIRCNLFLRLNGQMPGSTFRLRITGVVATIGGDFSTAVHSMRSIKVGNTGFPTQVDVQTAEDIATGTTLEFTVNPVTLEVTGP